MNENLPVMMNQVNQLENFEYRNLGNVITVRTETGEPLFHLVDVYDVLVINNNRNIMNTLIVYEYLTRGSMKQNTFVDQGNSLR